MPWGKSIWECLHRPVAISRATSSIPGLISAVLVSLTLNTCLASTGFALEPKSSLVEFQHTSWTTGDDAPPDIWSMAQGADGFLWLGTGAGLYRFDGVKFERIQPAGEQLKTIDITAVAAGAPGEVWMGLFDGGVSELKDGRLTNFSRRDGLPEGRVYGIAIEKSGVVWAAARNGLARYDHGHWQVIRKAWNYPAGRADHLLIAHDGTLWVTTGDALVALRPHSQTFEFVSALESSEARPVENAAGEVWISDPDHGIFPLRTLLAGGSIINGAEGVYGNFVHAKSILFDRTGGLWGTDEDRGGVFHIEHPQEKGRALLRSEITGVFSQREGLTAGNAVPVLLDSEGDIWVGTNLGVDRFRRTRFSPVPGIPTLSSSGYIFVAEHGGSILVADAHAVYRIRPDEQLEVVLRVEKTIRDIYVDKTGAIWLITQERSSPRQFLTQYFNGRLRPFDLPAASNKSEGVLFEDGDGALLVWLDTDLIMRLQNGVWSKLPEQFAAPVASQRVVTQDVDGSLWLSSGTNSIVRISRGKRRTFLPRDGLAVGDISTVQVVGGQIFVGGEQGIARFDGSRFQSIGADRAPELRGVTGIVGSSDGAIWINGISGVTRIPAAELMRAFQHSGYRLHPQLFDYNDGVVGVAQQKSFWPTAINGPGGKLWFITNHGVVNCDPLNLARNMRLPPVSVLGLTADGSNISPEDANLPPATKTIRIDYTAVSLPVPARVRFRYMLEGFDKNWIEAGTLRQATYTNLAPGRYLFHVIAANDDDVWNAAGAHIAFTVQPTFVQTIAFKVLCLAALTVLLSAAYRLRLRSITGRIHMQSEARLAERERIARDLHDTLLQGVHGLILRFQAVADQMSGSPLAVAVEQALERAEDLMIESREKLRDLRTPQGAEIFGDRLCAIVRQAASEAQPNVDLHVIGRRRPIQSPVCDGVVAIMQEAISNAAKHACAARIDARIDYGRERLTVSVCDDGVGIDPVILRAGERKGHFGFVGMREQAKSIRARLTIERGPERGTNITLIVPGYVAYGWRRWLPFAATGRPQP
jgi:signal transduction histidine kinase/ligand-binding sensor domain-containing protein